MNISEIKELNMNDGNVVLKDSYVTPVVDYSGKCLRDFNAEKKEWFKKWRESVGR